MHYIVCTFDITMEHIGLMAMEKSAQKLLHETLDVGFFKIHTGFNESCQVCGMIAVSQQGRSAEYIPSRYYTTMLDVLKHHVESNLSLLCEGAEVRNASSDVSVKTITTTMKFGVIPFDVTTSRSLTMFS